MCCINLYAKRHQDVVGLELVKQHAPLTALHAATPGPLDYIL